MLGLPWRIGKWVGLVAVGLCFLFLIGPLIVVVPLSFNAEPYFTFTKGMLSFDPEAYSLRWYAGLAEGTRWSNALVNSLIIGSFATVLATVLGTLAAIALSKTEFPARRFVTAMLISPMVTPIIVVGVGMFFFYSYPLINLTQTHLGLILAHSVLGAPFVLITVSASLAGFDYTLMRAAASLGANAWQSFRYVQLPLIAPGIATGSLFAFAASFDEVVIVLFMGGIDQRTIPREMWSGIREEINPSILAVATLLVILAVAILFAVEWLKARNVQKA